MKTLYLGKWDNYPSESPEREKAVQEVLKALTENGKVSIAFNYIGCTRHECAAYAMAEYLKGKLMLEGLNFTIDNYKFEIESWM